MSEKATTKKRRRDGVSEKATHRKTLDAPRGILEEAARLKVSPNTIRRRILRGELTAQKKDGKYMIGGAGAQEEEGSGSDSYAKLKEKKLYEEIRKLQRLNDLALQDQFAEWERCLARATSKAFSGLIAEVRKLCDDKRESAILALVETAGARQAEELGAELEEWLIERRKKV